LTDVFAVQDEIAEAIAAKLRVTFAKPVEDRAARPMTTHLEAYELCAQGRALLPRRGVAILRAVTCFERAIALDPDYAPAHAGLGDALRVQSMYGYARPAQLIPRAKAAIKRALELEANLADAVATLGLIALTYDRDMATGSDALARALALNPVLALARGTYAMLRQSLDRDADDQAIAEANRAVADDPLDALVAVYRAAVLGVAGRHSEAIAEADRAAALDPDSFAAHLAVVWVRYWGSDLEGALRAMGPALRMSGRHPWVLGFLSGIYAAGGDRSRAEAAHHELLGRAGTEYVQSCWLAFSAIGVGAADEAMRYAMRSVEERENMFAFFWIRWPGTELLQSHPDYPELRRRMGV
jgi:serine/threonine-protein kinase